MGLYAIGDLHLPGGDQKPMDVFGAHWENHFDRIRADWRARVSEDDTVLIPGDISWAMQMRDALDDLARIVDELGIDVSCFGILTDFRTELFPGSRRLVELADRIEMLQARPRCWCGAPATHNARVVDGVMVVEGDQIAVGDTEGGGAGVVAYETLCRAHHRVRQPAVGRGVDATPDPLPFGEA